MADADPDKKKVIATNRKARFEYEILDTWEAGLVLVGPEVKALRDGKASLGDAYAEVRRGEVWLLNAHIGAYEQAGRENVAPLRDRKLLLLAARQRSTILACALGKPGKALKDVISYL